MNDLLPVIGAPLSCTKCPALCGVRTHVVNSQDNPDTAEIMIIGQNPALMDDQSNIVMTGIDGILLQEIVKAAGIPRSSVYRTYAVRCLTPGYRKPSKEEIENCRPFLIEEIKRVQPSVIVLLGDVPLQALYGIGEPNTYATDLAKWGSAVIDERDDWQRDLLAWRALSPTERKSVSRPLKPKPATKPRKPVARRVAIKDVMGHTLTQTDTGVPMIATYSPAYIRNGHWQHAEMVIAHFAKAMRIADGTQSVGTLGNYKTIKTIQELRDLKDYLLKAKVIAYDTETTGLKWMYHDLMCISFSTKAGEGFVVPVLYNTGGLRPEMWPEWDINIVEWWGIIKEIFGSNIPKLAQNGLFDMRMLERTTNDYVAAGTGFGWRVNGELRDTELLHHSIQEFLPHNMTTLIGLYTDMPFYETGVGQYKKQMDKAPNDLLWAYSAADADGLFRLWGVMRPMAEDEGTEWVLDNITMPMLRVCRDMEERGFPINVGYFNRLADFYRYQIAEAEQELWDCCPTLEPDWKYNYAPVLREVLFVHLKLKPAPKHRKTPSGRGCAACKKVTCIEHLSTSKDAIEDMIREGETHPILEHIKTLKFMVKRQSTYLDGRTGDKGFKKWIRPDNRIHSTQKISRVETGRLASEEPNDKNIPNYVHVHSPDGECTTKECKSFYDMAGALNIETTNAFHDMVEAPAGRGIMTADWAQLEIWVLAYRIWQEFGNRVLLDILESGADIHMWMARQMFSDLDPKLTDTEWRTRHPELRRRAKAADFGVGYGLTAQGMMLRENCTLEEAEDLIARYKKIVPVDQYFRSIKQQLENRGYVENEFGRRRHMPHLKLLRKMARWDTRISNIIESAIREAINFPIQSSGSDLHSYSSAQVNDLQSLAQRGAYVILSVHDSLSFEFDYPNDEFAKHTAFIIKNTMQNIAWNMLKPDGTPLHWKVPVEVEWGVKWGSPTMKIDAAGQYGPT